MEQGLGQLLKEARRRRGWTQEEAADRLGIQRSYLAADLSSALTADQVMAQMEAQSGSAETKRERARLEKQLAKLAEKQSRAEKLVLSGVRDVTWLRDVDLEITAERMKVSERIDKLPDTPSHDHLSILDSAIHNIGLAMTSASEDATRECIIELGHVVFSRGVVSIRYHPQYQPFIIAPHSEEIGKPRA